MSFLNPFRYSGGGEVVLRELLEYARSKGVFFNETYLRPFAFNFDPRADITLVADIFNLPDSRRFWPGPWLKKLLDYKGKLVFFHNAYVDICDLDYLPCNGNYNSICHFKKAQKNQKCSKDNKWYALLYERADLHVFVSPLHQEISQKLMGRPRSSFVLRPLIDTFKFTKVSGVKDIKYLFAGAITEAKGLNNLVQFMQDKDPNDLYLVGKKVDHTPKEFKNYLGFIPYEQMPRIFQRAENFVYLPRWPEPQGRVVCEAALSGCHLVTNENVGACSFPFDLSDPRNYSKVKEEFWSLISKFVQKDF